MANESISNKLWSTCNKMRQDPGTTGALQYVEQFSWLLFLKVYEEIENEGGIRKILNIPVTKDMEHDLEDNGYFKFCTCKTTRKKYKNGFFGIDIDFVDFDDFNYELTEIELMIENKLDIEDAIKKIMIFAEGKGLKIGPVRGKVVEYLKRKKPDHYLALVKSGTVKDF